MHPTASLSCAMRAGATGRARAVASGPGSGWDFGVLRHRLDLAIATIGDDLLDTAKALQDHTAEIRQAPQLSVSLFAAMPLYPLFQ